MSIFLLGAFSIAQYITNPISLTAFAIAAVLTYLIRRDFNRTKQINSANPQERADVIINTSEKLHLDLSKVPESERALLITQALKTRIATNIIIAIVVIVFGFLFTYIVQGFMNSTSKEDKPSNTDTSVAIVKKDTLIDIEFVDSIKTGLDSMAKRELDSTAFLRKASKFNLNEKGPKIRLEFISEMYDTSFVFFVSIKKTLTQLAGQLVRYFDFDDDLRNLIRDDEIIVSSKWEVYINYIKIPQKKISQSLEKLGLKDMDKISLEVNLDFRRARRQVRCPVNY